VPAEDGGHGETHHVEALKDVTTGMAAMAISAQLTHQRINARILVSVFFIVAPLPMWAVDEGLELQKT